MNSLCLQARIMPIRRNNSQQLCLCWRRIVEIRYWKKYQL